MNLKKSTDRMLYLAGMALAFIGMLIPFVRIEDEGVKNVFSAAVYFNQPGIAYISTFVVIVWLAALAGIILYFITDFVVGDFLAWLVGAAFGIAATITLSLETLENPFGYMFIGSYLTFIGYTASLVALILEAKHIQHPLAKKTE